MSSKHSTAAKGHHTGHTIKNEIPETVVDEIGTPKRNILRKGKHPKYRKDEASGKMIEDIVDAFAGDVKIDKDDPNYDSEAEIDEISFLSMSLTRDDDGLIGKSKLTLTKYKKIIEPLIGEFFINGEYDDLRNNILDIGCVEYGYEFVKRAINMSFDKGDRERELVSKFLCYAHPDLLSSNVVGKGFERLFEIIDEVEKDAPAAREMLSKFLARAVIDEVLPPSFLKDACVRNLGGEIVDHAIRMLTREHAGAKLEACWGPGDGRPVEDLKVAVDLLLEEYLLSGDIDEALRCIIELQAPFFFHEIVKRAVVQALDKSIEQQLSMSKLLVQLKEKDLLKKTQAVLGFKRLFTILDDLSLDTPCAGKIVLQFSARAIADGVLPSDFTSSRLVNEEKLCLGVPESKISANE